MTGIERIAAERKRQIEKEGYTPEYDLRRNSARMIADAGAAYGMAYRLLSSTRIE